MANVIEQMLSRYEVTTIDEERNAMKEVIQEVVLSALAKAGFFKEAAFYGGTALRIFYGLKNLKKIQISSFQNIFGTINKTTEMTNLIQKILYISCFQSVLK